MPHDRETPVVLSRIYTRTGDDGTTALGDMSRARKTDPRLAAYADTDEANSSIGVAVTMGRLPDEITALLVRIQNELFDVGADLCNPVSADPAYPPLRIDASYITGLELACDEFNEGLPVLRSFVLPGGSPAAALLHVARTVVRRAERSTWAALEVHGETMNPLTAQYLNRLSDLLFILGRRVNEPDGDLLWKPGGER
jgi:cob(I)alamin adenosyltransferase